ncbi:hypothetical protein [Tumebacillus algifaecis]|nr:hypothetical protein [Tumebacillus algifaecis]
MYRERRALGVKDAAWLKLAISIHKKQAHDSKKRQEFSTSF